MYIYKYILLLMYVDENLFGYWRLLEYSLCYPNALGNYYYHHNEGNNECNSKNAKESKEGATFAFSLPTVG